VRLEGLHHITAITGDAAANVDFYTRVLGLRMVAKTVNQDDPTVYHLFYADEVGSPGADITFFEYPGAPPGRAGAGMVHRVVWRVASREARRFWSTRLQSLAPTVTETDASVLFSDNEGLAHELIVDTSDDAPLRAVDDDIPAEFALRGFAGVRAYAARRDASRALLTSLLGAAPTDRDTLEIRGAERGATITFDDPPTDRGLQGGGVIHHIAWFSTVADHGAWLTRVQEAGVPTSGIVDRHYFRSIYFREPSGILYEIADDGPGFTRDLPLADLGTRVILPPWLESQRAVIEATLTPLPAPRRPRHVSA
jgi:glyoxalase family protein